MKKTLLCPLLLLALAVPASAMYRCVVPAGPVSFQDEPCAPGMTQQVLHPDPSPPSSSPSEVRMETEKLHRELEASDRATRKLQLERELLPAAQAALAAERQSCQSGLAALKAQLDSTHGGRRAGQRNDLLQQQAALRSDCERKGRAAADKVETLRAECIAMKCNAD